MSPSSTTVKNSPGNTESGVTSFWPSAKISVQKTSTSSLGGNGVWTKSTQSASSSANCEFELVSQDPAGSYKNDACSKKSSLRHDWVVISGRVSHACPFGSTQSTSTEMIVSQSTSLGGNGDEVGCREGFGVGPTVGALVGCFVGDCVGRTEGDVAGGSDGAADGDVLGREVGENVGRVGESVVAIGAPVGWGVFGGGLGSVGCEVVGDVVGVSVAVVGISVAAVGELVSVVG